MTRQSVAALAVALSALLGGAAYFGSPNEERQLENEQAAYFQQHGRYNRSPAHLSPDCTVIEYVSPNGAGWQHICERGNAVISKGYGPEAEERTFTNPNPSPQPPRAATSTFNDALQTILALFRPQPAYAVSTTQGTLLNRASSQFWSITNAAQTGLSVSNSNASYSISANIKLTTLPSVAGSAYAIVSKGRDSADGYVLLIDTADDLGLNKAGKAAIGTPWAPSTATWYHVTAVQRYSGATPLETEFYVNGSSIGTVSDSTTYNAESRTFRIGAFETVAGADTSFFGGRIYDVRVFSYALSDANVTSLNSDPCNYSTANMTGRWYFDGDATDETSNNNDLTANNSPTFSSDIPYSCDKPVAGAGEEDPNTQADLIGV